MATKRPKKSSNAEIDAGMKLVRFQARATRIMESSPRGVARRIVNGIPLIPAIDGLGDRTKLAKPQRVRIPNADAAKVVDPEVMKGKVARASDYIGSYYGVNGIRPPEYDMLEPFTLVDTEAYLKQAINRKISLMFRSGFEVTSEQARHADYIRRRLQTMEFVTGRDMTDLFRSILYNLSLCSNCFVLKIRDEKGSTGVKSEKNNNRTPVAGYSIIPAHSLFPWMEKGVITKWRRFYETGMPYEDISVDDIIHFKWDVKPGHVFGTPRTVAVRDDIFALRRLEENVELLFINYLFPLMHVQVGTEDEPCDYYENGVSEIDYVRSQIENMPKEGVFVTDQRVTVENVGSQGHALEFKEFVAHLKGRVYTGLGMSAVDMGEGDTANRATADNISQVLKDSIKNDQSSFSGQVRMNIFKELFQESSSSLSIQGAVAETKLEWHEVDTDGKIKEENHASVLFGQNLIGRSEARKRMRQKPMDKEVEKDTMHEKITKDLATHQSKLSRQEAAEDVDNQKALAETQIKVMQAEVEKEHGKAAAEHKKAEAKGKMVGHQVTLLKAKTAHHKATGGSKKKKGAAATAQSKNTPSNQHGTNPGPTKAKSAREFMETLRDRLTSMDALANNDAEWKDMSGVAIEGVIREFEQAEIGEDAENSYTRQVRKGADRLKELVANTRDPELLEVLLSAEFEDTDDDGEQSTTGTSDSESELGDFPFDAREELPDPDGSPDTLRDPSGDSNPASGTTA